jgi:hypothetical protein
MKTYNTSYTPRFLLALMFSIGIFISPKTQDIYGTTNGIIDIAGVWNGKNLIASSNKLQVELNYETAEIQIRLDVSTLRTGIDTLDQILSRQGRDFLVYDGQLGIDYISTLKHPAQQFGISGTLSCAHSDNNFRGVGLLEHIEADLYSCVLTMSFEMSFSDTNLEIELPGLEDRFRISIIQIILRRDNDR